VAQQQEHHHGADPVQRYRGQAHWVFERYEASISRIILIPCDFGATKAAGVPCNMAAYERFPAYNKEYQKC